MQARIRIGNQTAFSAARAEEPFEFALAHGLDAFEFFADVKPVGGGGTRGWSPARVDAAGRSALAHLARQRDLALSVHAPWDADPLVDEGPAVLLESLAFARDLAARVMVVHLCPQHDPDAFLRALTPVLEQAAGAGVLLALENTPACSPEWVSAFFARPAIAGRVGTGVGLCLDIGHAALHETTRGDSPGWLDRLASRVPIVHVHVHENHGDRDSHLPLFTGPAALDDAPVRGLVARLLARGFRGMMIMEQWPEPPGLLLEVRRRLRDLLPVDAGGVR